MKHCYQGAFWSLPKPFCIVRWGTLIIVRKQEFYQINSDTVKSDVENLLKMIINLEEDHQMLTKRH